MERNLMVKRLALVSLVMASAASAQTSNVTPAHLEKSDGELINRFGISYRAGFNISAKFKRIGGYQPTANTNPNIVTQYDDGFIGLDSSGNLGDETQFWGYSDASQYQNDSIIMSRSTSIANGVSKGQEEDPQHGLELTYSRQLGVIEKAKWGVEAAFNYTDLTIGDHGRVAGNVEKSRFAYSLGGNIPPAAPFLPTSQSPSSPLLSTIATPLPSTSEAGGAVTTGGRSLDANIFGVRLGPYLEIPMCDRVSLWLSGGLSVLVVDSEFKFKESTSVSQGLNTRSGSGSNSDVLAGSYVGVNLVYAINEKLSLTGGAQFQAAGHYTHVESGKKAELDLGQSFFLSVGLGYSF